MKEFFPIPVPRPGGSDKLPAKGLIAHYHRIRPAIKRRIAEFRSIIEGRDREEIFSELCFCILTANANAAKCHEAIKELRSLDLLKKAHAGRIKPMLKGRVRFHNKKADFVVGARRHLRGGTCVGVEDILGADDVVAIRDRLVNDVKGYGYKEASHFLRNIGLGADIAILDRHVLKNLKAYGVIGRIPPSVGARAVYLAIEEKMRAFSKETGIPMDELDLLFWSMQTGFIFK